MSPERGFTPPYEISYRGVKLPKVSAALGCFDLRRGADLPLVGYPASEKGKHRRTSPNAEVQLGIRVAVLRLGPDLLCLPRGGPPPRTRLGVPATASTEARTPSLGVSRRRAWHGVIGVRPRLRIGIGVGVLGGDRLGAVLALGAPPSFT